MTAVKISDFTWLGVCGNRNNAFTFPSMIIIHSFLSKKKKIMPDFLKTTCFQRFISQRTHYIGKLKKMIYIKNLFSTTFWTFSFFLGNILSSFLGDSPSLLVQGCPTWFRGLVYNFLVVPYLNIDWYLWWLEVFTAVERTTMSWPVCVLQVFKL